MPIDVRPAFNTLRRLHPTIARLVGIFAGIFIMGAHDFLVFYFVHMLLKSLTALFFVDGSILVFRLVRRRSAIDLSQLSLLFAMSLLSSLVILAFYLMTILIFDNFISPKTIDIDFFLIYSLTIISSVLIPFSGVIRAKGSHWVNILILRGRNMLNLVFILVFVIVGIEGKFLPYVWLSSSLIMSFLVLAFGIFYFCSTEKIGTIFPVDWARARMISRRIIGYSAHRTNNRATFLATKGVMSAFLGPFAGLALKSIRFGNQGRRQHYVAKIKSKSLVNQFDDRIPDAVRRKFERERLFKVVLTLAVLVLAIIVLLRGTLDAFLLLGLLVLASKMLSVSLRVLTLNLLISRGFV